MKLIVKSLSELEIRSSGLCAVQSDLLSSRRSRWRTPRATASTRQPELPCDPSVPTAQLRSSGRTSMRTSTSDVAASPTQRLHGCGWKSLHACAASALQAGSDEHPAPTTDANAGANVNLHRHANDLLYYAQGNCNTNTSRVGDSNKSIYLSQGNCDISRRYPGAIHPAAQTGHAEVAAGTVGRIGFQSCQLLESMDQQAFSG